MRAAGGLKAGPAAERFPWDAILCFGLGRLRLNSRDFWALTLPEFAAMTGFPGLSFAPARKRLDDLMTMFPDGGKHG